MKGQGVGNNNKHTNHHGGKSARLHNIAHYCTVLHNNTSKTGLKTG